MTSTRWGLPIDRLLGVLSPTPAHAYFRRVNFERAPFGNQLLQSFDFRVEIVVRGHERSKCGALVTLAKGHDGIDCCFEFLAWNCQRRGCIRSIRHAYRIPECIPITRPSAPSSLAARDDPVEDRRCARRGRVTSAWRRRAWASMHQARLTQASHRECEWCGPGRIRRKAPARTRRR